MSRPFVILRIHPHLQLLVPRQSFIEVLDSSNFSFIEIFFDVIIVVGQAQGVRITKNHRRVSLSCVYLTLSIIHEDNENLCVSDESHALFVIEMDAAFDKTFNSNE